VHGRPLAAVGNGASAVAIFIFFSLFFICLSWQNCDDIEAQLVWFITETEMLSSVKF
jgi:hypothetical protein